EFAQKLRTILFDIKLEENSQFRIVKGGKALAAHLNDNSPKVLPLIKDNMPAVANLLIEINPKIGEFYDLFYFTGGWAGRAEPKPLAYYAFLIMLLLTLISAFLHSARSKTRIGKPVPLILAGAGAPTMPLAAPTASRGDAMAVEAVGKG